MLRRLAGPAMVLGLSFIATAAWADNSDDSDPDEQAQEEPAKTPPFVPGLTMSTRGTPLSDDRPPPDPNASREEQEEYVLDNNPPNPEMTFKVSDNLLDRTVTLPEDAKGQPDLDYYYRMEEGDLKTGGGFKTPSGAYGDTSVAMTWRVENGTVAFAAPGDVTMQTPIGLADSMEMASDAVNMGLSYVPTGAGGF
jgi:hypothetical protein